MAEEEYVGYLHSVRNYKNLDNDNFKEHGDTTKCNPLKLHTTNYPNFNDFCLKLTGILNKFNELPSSFLFDNNRCKFIYMWTYDKLFNGILNKTEDKIDSLMGWMHHFWHRDGNYICDINTDLPKRMDFEKMKVLYDYATDYESLKKYLEDSQFLCTEAFKTYLEQIVNVYTEAKGTCTNASPEKYCKLLTIIDNKYNSNELSELNCKGLKPVIHDRPDSLDARVVPEQEDSHSSNAVVFVFPLISIILTFLILYKFTPFGRWINSRFLKKRVIESQIDEEQEYEFTEHSYVPMNTNSQNGTHNISYHSMENL
ncbi:PIR Superfamily Protein [Plasmodium ovale wallikeri]|uniref:PIR Superfamily Protein n=2 Tax=Plasmodium ovale TaxID=36330 RepID=A0A1A9AIZ1_PLAOA|nr:PIR Superfamily Protein [Plasmodium ovale wallikeri]SBT56165.1 PIR Superfamily Protein [Plasmodium ovale wallikeri]SBT73097.1 PIR protein [Plasmodium ovale]